MIGRVEFANCRSGGIGLAVARKPGNDGHLSLWQKARW